MKICFHQKILTALLDELFVGTCVHHSSQRRCLLILCKRLVSRRNGHAILSGWVLLFAIPQQSHFTPCRLLTGHEKIFGGSRKGCCVPQTYGGSQKCACIQKWAATVRLVNSLALTFLSLLETHMRVSSLECAARPRHVVLCWQLTVVFELRMCDRDKTSFLPCR